MGAPYDWNQDWDLTKDGKVIRMDGLRPRPKEQTPSGEFFGAGEPSAARRRAVRRRRPRRRKRNLAAALLCVLLLFLWRPWSGNRALPPPEEANRSGTDSGEAIVVPAWVVPDLLPRNEYSRPGTPLEQVNGVVVHYVGNPGTTAEQNRSYYAGLAETHETWAGSHFVIGMDGTVIQCVPLDEIAYCSNNRNGDTISSECCHPDDSGEFTRDTLDALTKLLNWLIDTYGLEREDILRHYDVTGKECPRYFVTCPERWEEYLDGLFVSSN